MKPSNKIKSVFTVPFLTAIYVLLLGLWALVWLFMGDATWWLTLLHRFVPYFFLPALLSLILLLRARQFKFILLLIIPGLLFGLLYHPHLLPKPPLAAAADVSVMTYNVLYSNRQYDAVAAVILDNHPDLVALQEVQPEMMAALQTRLTAVYPHSLLGAAHPYGTIAVFSRHPILDSTVLDLEADRSATMVEVEIEGQAVTFIAAHLLAYGLWWVDWQDVPATVVARTADQNRQAQLLLAAAEKQEGIVIIGCDCNSKETSSSYRILAGALQNTSRQVGWRLGGGLATGKPGMNLQRIDHIFYGGALNPLSFKVIQDRGGSDHVPLVATYRFD